jgi:hypothetical protein
MELTLSACRGVPLSPLSAGVALAAAAAPLLLSAPALAGPVVCTTTLEALAGSGESGALETSGPVEVTRCAAVETTPELVQQRLYTWTSPFAPGISVRHQITDLFGIARGGIDGKRRMGLGFPDQTIVWDGTAVQNTVRGLMEDQSDPVPWRTADVSNCFNASLGASCSAPSPWQDGGASWSPPVRGLW